MAHPLLTRVSPLTASAAALLILGACSRGEEKAAQIESNGAVTFNVQDEGGKQSEGDFRDFNAVTLVGPDDVRISMGKDFSVRAEGSPEALARLDIKLEGQELKIGRKRGVDSTGHDRGAIIHVTMPGIARASLTGSGDLSIEEAKGEALALALTGSGDMDVDGVTVKSLKVATTGSGSVEIAGLTDQADFSITGSGDIDAERLRVDKAEVSILGSGSASFASDGQVSASIMGSGDVEVKGKAVCRKSGLGSGEARCAG